MAGQIEQAQEPQTQQRPADRGPQGAVSELPTVRRAGVASRPSGGVQSQGHWPSTSERSSLSCCSGSPCSSWSRSMRGRRRERAGLA